MAQVESSIWSLKRGSMRYLAGFVLVILCIYITIRKMERCSITENRQARLLLVGLGTFGSGWYQQIKHRHSDLQVATVDSDAARGAEITSTNSEAIEQEEPDLSSTRRRRTSIHG